MPRNFARLPFRLNSIHCLLALVSVGAMAPARLALAADEGDVCRYCRHGLTDAAAAEPKDAAAASAPRNYAPIGRSTCFTSNST